MPYIILSYFLQYSTAKYSIGSARVIFIEKDRFPLRNKQKKPCLTRASMDSVRRSFSNCRRPLFYDQNKDKAMMQKMMNICINCPTGILSSSLCHFSKARRICAGELGKTFAAQTKFSALISKR